MAIVTNSIKITVVFVILSSMGACGKTRHHASQSQVQCPLYTNENDYAVILPHPTNCSLFYICNYGIPIGFQCPDGLNFNPKLLVCDWPYHAKCNSRHHAYQPEWLQQTYRQVPHATITNLPNETSISDGEAYTSPQSTETSSPSNTFRTELHPPHYHLDHRQHSANTTQTLQMDKWDNETSTTLQANTTEEPGTNETEHDMAKEFLFRRKDIKNNTEEMNSTVGASEPTPNTTEAFNTTEESSTTTNDIGNHTEQIGNITNEYANTTEHSATEEYATTNITKKHHKKHLDTSVEPGNATAGNVTNTTDIGISTTENSTNETANFTQTTPNGINTTAESGNTTQMDVITTEGFNLTTLENVTTNEQSNTTGITVKKHKNKSTNIE